jgi:uncharacterized protein (UPF0276 family)
VRRRPVPSTAKDPIPARAGVGFKLEHYREIVEQQPDIGWFEVHAENYMEEGGPPHRFLSALRQCYPLSVHGVGLSIGADAPLDRDHLLRLKAVCDRYQPGLVSEHLAWSTHDGVYLNDLLPLPYNKSTLQRVCEHIDEVQACLRRKILLENPSTYVLFENSEMTEVEFLAAVVKATGCSLLLDVNNVHVSAINHEFDAGAYVDSFPIEHVGEIHLGGYAEDSDDTGARLLIDAHGSPVTAPVWVLYERVIARGGSKPTLIEWDNDIPAWPALFAEAQRADYILARRATNGRAA